MNILLRTTTAISAAAIMSLALAGTVNAGQPKPYMTDTCNSQQTDCTDQGNQGAAKKRVQGDQSINGQLTDEKSTADKKTMKADSGWKFDPNKHQRHRQKDNVFRFAYGGFWYPQPYWQGYGLSSNGYTMSYGVSCRDGRNVVSDNGFNRVRTVECQGRSFTYVGKRHGHSYQVLVSSRSGRIINVRPI